MGGDLKKFSLFSKIIIFVVLFGSIACFGYGQHYPIRFNHLNTRDGLSHNRVTSIYKDQLGYMWFGTLSGLNRYNGYEFKTFKHSPSDTYTLNDNSIQWLGEGPNGHLWIKTNSGFSAYDVYKEQFVDTAPVLDSLGFIPGDILKMITGTDGRVWVVARNAGVKFLDTSGNSHNVNISGKTTITDIDFDLQGNLLAISDLGDLYRFDTQEQKIIQSIRLEGINRANNYQLSLFRDSEDGIWIWSKNISIGLLYYENPAASPRKIGDSKTGSEVVTSVLEDELGQITITTDHGGMTVLNKSEWTFKCYKNNPTDDKSLSHSSAISSYLDKDGMMWVGTNKAGVNYYHPGGGSFNYLKYEGDKSVLYNDINAIVEDDKGNFWIGTDGAGLIYFDRGSNTFRPYSRPEDSHGLNSNIIVSMLNDGQGIWLGTYHGGLSYFDGRSFKRYFNNPLSRNALSDESIWEIFKDSKGNLWIGTLQGGVDVYDRDLKKIHHFGLNNNTINSNYITSIDEDAHGNIWIGTGYGIEVYNPETGKFKHYLNDPKDQKSLLHNSIVSINICEEGEIWIGTYGGVNKYNPEQDSFISFTEKEGLISNFIVSLAEDEYGSIWVGSNKGLSRISFAGSEYIIQNFDEADGLQGDSFNANAVLQTNDGKLAFGGLNGLNVFDPADIRETEKPQNLIFTDFAISNKRVNSGDIINGRQLFADGLNRAEQVELLPFENSFTIEFTALSYYHPEKTLYRYKLEGFDPEWVTAPADQRRINYTNLDPGEYIFKVQASNGQDNWGQEEINMMVTIQTPFWETPFAFVLYGIIGLSIFLGIRKIIIDRERLNAQIKQDKLEAQRLHQLDMMKIRFFTNVSHEFRTPLSLILTPIERLLKFGSKERAENDYLMIRRNARRLLNLVNQLLDFRKIESGQLSLCPSGGDLIHFMKDIIDSFSDLSREKNIPIQFKTDIKELLTTFDRDKVEKIMFNLLSNAFKFTHSGGQIFVEINKIGEEAGINSIQVKVTDTGIGIPLDKLEHIFTRFFQIDTPSHLVNHGSGIGLSITKEFVELHGGTIEVQSDVNQGSCFTIILPLKKITAIDEMLNQNQQLRPVKTLPAEAQDLDKEKPTILIAEDNIDFRFYLKDNLKQYFNILDSSNGKDAWKLALNNIPDLIVSDIMMPIMNGLELTKKVKSDPRTAHIPVILLTAHASHEYKIDGHDAGAIKYITKPFNFEILISSIRGSLKFQEQVRDSDKLIEVAPAEIEITSLDEKLINNALALVEENMENADFSVQELSRELGVSRGQLYKKILAITGKTPIEFIRDIRLKRAVTLLQKSQLTVAEVAYKVGFNNPRYFTKYFKAAYKTLPSKYLRNEEVSTLNR